jgi:hypothetical protein
VRFAIEEIHMDFSEDLFYKPLQSKMPQFPYTEKKDLLMTAAAGSFYPSSSITYFFPIDRERISKTYFSFLPELHVFRLIICIQI